MQLPQLRRPRISPLAVCGLALGLAVLMWGAGYKIEQYPQQGFAFRVMAPAKLLTENERPSRDGCTQSAPDFAAGKHQPRQPLTASIAVVSVAALQARPMRTPALLARPRRIDPAELSFFFFRPPPSHLSA